MKRHKLKVILGLAMASGLGIAAPQMAPVQAAPYYTTQSSATVRLNGQPLATSVPPTVENGRTLVPMRDIFEALGASVNWNANAHSIEAHKGDTRVWLQIGNREARINNRQVLLDQAPEIQNGSTLVPLRFVSEALGAQVNWNGANRLVEITASDVGTRHAAGDRDRNRWNDHRRPGSDNDGQQVAGMITVPRNTVIPVTTDKEISSKTARVGDVFWTTVKSERPGDSEFPQGTRLKGVVTQVTPKTNDQSGAIVVEFTGMELPSGQRQSINGSLISLDKDDVEQAYPGRIMAKDKKESGADAKTVLIGAGAGYALGHILLKQNSVLSAALGALGGYLYGRNQGDKVKPQEAVVPAGTELGVRLNRSVSYEDRYGYRSIREPYLR